MIDIVLFLAVLATLLVVVAVSQPVAVRLKLAPVVLLAVIGVAIGTVSGVLLHTAVTNRFDNVAALFANLPVGAETFIYVFLPLLVFEGAITADVRRMLEDAAPILMLAVVATVVCTAVVGFALWPIAGLPLVVCLLLGLGRRDHRPGGRHRGVPRCGRGGAAHPPRRGRSSPE